MWITPKTDWVASDYIMPIDYKRIVGNMKYLQSFASKLRYQIELEYLESTKTKNDKPYARILNAIENNIEELNEKTFNFDIGETKTYVANGHPFDYNELNRIENATLKIYKQLVVQRDTVMHYPQQYNGSSIYKVARIHYVDHQPMAHRLEFRLGSRKGVI